MHTLRCKKYNNKYIQNNSHFHIFGKLVQDFPKQRKKVSDAAFGFECLSVWGCYMGVNLHYSTMNPIYIEFTVN